MLYVSLYLRWRKHFAVMFFSGLTTTPSPCCQLLSFYTFRGYLSTVYYLLAIHRDLCGWYLEYLDMLSGMDKFSRHNTISNKDVWNPEHIIIVMVLIFSHVHIISGSKNYKRPTSIIFHSDFPPFLAPCLSHDCMLQLQPKVREDFTIIEKVPNRAFCNLKVHTTMLSHLRHY